MFRSLKNQYLVYDRYAAEQATHKKRLNVGISGGIQTVAQILSLCRCWSEGYRNAGLSYNRETITPHDILLAPAI